MKDLFEAALELAPERRAAFLTQACGNDAALRGEVELLLEHHERTGSFLSSRQSLVGASAAIRPVFPPGEIVSGRFRIVRFIGRGGIGEVYEARDLELGTRVALKTLRPEIALNAWALDRLKQEIQLARQVTHPNVCRIFDMGRHRAPGAREGGSTDRVFFTMELLEGESLADRLHREGRMSFGKALPLIRQMAAALQAAHNARVIHCDFKPSNVLLVAQAAPECPTRAVVTDFGLARANADTTFGSESFVRSITAPGQLLGTLAYMAPEQLEGREATTATDVYALGLVIYELITGRRPFPDDAPLAGAFLRIKEPPPSPRNYLPDLDAACEQSILFCLRTDPAKRFQSAREVVESFENSVGHPMVAVDPREIPSPGTISNGVWARAADRRLSLSWFSAFPRRVHWLVGVVIALGILLALALWFSVRHSGTALKIWSTRPTIALSAGTGNRKSVAVVGFRNLSGNPADAWLATALTEWLTTDLSAGGKLRIIPEESVARMRVELGLTEPDRMGRDALTKVRDNLGTDLVVSGSYARSGSGAGNTLRLDLRLQDVRSGQILNAVSATGRASEIFDLASRGGGQLRRALGLESLSPAGVAAVRESLPSDPEAARFYADGIARLQRFDAAEARALLERAVAIEPQHAPSHAALATAWSTLGYSASARAEAQAAFELSRNLPTQEKLLVEAQFRESSYDWDKAIDIYRSLFALYPDNVEYGLGLARVETAASRPLMALETIRRLHQLSAPSGEDPRIDLAEAEAAASISDFRRQREAATKAVAKGRRDGAGLLEARAEIVEGEALRVLGNFADALAIWGEAKEKFASAGDRGALARILIDEGKLRWQRGEPERAKESYEEAITIGKEIGDQGDLGRALSGLGVVQMFQAGPAEGRKLCDAALALFRRIGNRQEEAYTLSLTADLIAYRHKEAKPLYEQSLALSREVNDRSRIAGRLMDLGIMATVQGDLPTATQDLEQALQIYRDIGERNREALQLNSLAIVFKWEGKLDQAEQYASEAISILTLVGETNVRGQVRETLAVVQMEHGKLAEAERTIRLALEDHRQARDAGSIGIATGYLAEILADQGRFTESQAALQEYDTIVRLNPPPGEHLPAMHLTRARLYAAAGQFGAALREARRACTETLKMDQGSVHMKARLVLAEIELQSGNREVGRLHLEQLVHDAEARDFGLIAQKARQALQTPTAEMRPGVHSPALR